MLPKKKTEVQSIAAIVAAEKAVAKAAAAPPAGAAGGGGGRSGASTQPKGKQTAGIRALEELSRQDFKRSYENQCTQIGAGLIRFGFRYDIGLTIMDITQQVADAVAGVDRRKVLDDLFEVGIDAATKWAAMMAAWKPESPEAKHPSKCWTPCYVLDGNPLLKKTPYAYPLVGPVTLMFPKEQFKGGIVPDLVFCPWCMTAGPSEKRADCPLGLGKDAQILHLQPQGQNVALDNALLALLFVQASTWTERPIAPPKMVRWILMAMRLFGIERTDLELPQLEFLAFDSAQEAILMTEKADRVQAENAALRAKLAALEVAAAKAARQNTNLENQLRTTEAAVRRSDAAWHAGHQAGTESAQLLFMACAGGRPMTFQCTGCGYWQPQLPNPCANCRMSNSVQEPATGSASTLGCPPPLW